VQSLLLLTYHPDRNTQEGTPEFDAEMRRWSELNDELRKSGRMVAATGLKEGVTTVRAEGGEVTVTDGPYAETKEVLFSFYVLDLPDLDAAIAFAKELPVMQYGSVEIRATDGLEVA
jgi:hypothetical protein